METVRTPYIETLEKNLADQDMLLGLLLRRSELLELHLKEVNDLRIEGLLQRNSYEIEAVELKGKISSLKKIIAEKRKYFEQYAQEFDKRLKEADFHFKRVYGMALNKSKTDKELEAELKRVGNIDEIKQNLEYFVNFYERLKKYIS